MRRVQPLEALLADYATNVCGLPLRRQENVDDDQPSVTWSIDGEPMAQLLVTPEGPDRLVIHELSLLGPARKAVRTRHIQIDYPN